MARAVPSARPRSQAPTPHRAQALAAEIVDAHPGAFLRGLIHSDGCRTINRFTTRLPSGRVAAYACPRYCFSNPSPDTRALFCQAAERLGLRRTQSNHRNTSIAHRRSVDRLDELVVPKA